MRYVFFSIAAVVTAINAPTAQAQVVQARACTGSPLRPPDVWSCPGPSIPTSACADEDATWRPDRVRLLLVDRNGGNVDPGDVLEYSSLLDHMPGSVWFTVYWWSCLPDGLIHLGVDRMPYAAPPTSQVVDKSTSDLVFPKTWYGETPGENPAWITGQIQVDATAAQGQQLPIHWIGGSHSHVQLRWLAVDVTITVGQPLPPIL